MIHIVGAGSGATDLITLRGARLLRAADVVVWAGSLVNPELLAECKESCVVYDSAHMTLEEVLDVMCAADARGEEVVRLHTGDPCLYGVKEACPVPLVGIAEAGIAMATLCGAKFSILASSAKAKPMMESMVQQYGMNDRMASVETFDLPIEDFMKDRDLLCRKVKETADSASAKGAEVLLLGCAGMTMISDVLDGLTDIPAIDPIKAGVESLLAMLRGGFKISRAGLYA